MRLLNLAGFDLRSIKSEAGMLESVHDLGKKTLPEARDKATVAVLLQAWSLGNRCCDAVRKHPL